jgi:hypothetical protein
MNDTKQLKQALHQSIDKINDKEFLESIQKILARKQAGSNWENDISDAEKRALTQAIQEADNSEPIPHKQVRAKIEQRFFS